MQGLSSTLPGLLGSVLESHRTTYLASVSLLCPSSNTSHQVDSRVEKWGNQPHLPRGRFWVFILIDVPPVTHLPFPGSHLTPLCPGQMRQLTGEKLKLRCDLGLAAEGSQSLPPSVAKEGGFSGEQHPPPAVEGPQNTRTEPSYTAGVSLRPQHLWSPPLTFPQPQPEERGV